MPPWKKTGLPSQKREDAEEGRAKLKTTALTTKSTAGLGRGMGVKDWLPKKPEAIATPDSATDSEKASAGAGQNQKGKVAPPTDLEVFLAKYGIKPPAWMEGVTLPEWLSNRIAGRKRKPKKRKEEPKPHVPQPLPIPKTLPGMMWIKAKDGVAGVARGLRARNQFRKRLRQMEGPGPLEQAATEYIFQPSISIAKEAREHCRAYFGVNEGFKTQTEIVAELESPQEPHSKGNPADNTEGKHGLTPAIINWHQLEDMQQRIQTVLAVLAAATILFGIAIHERQFRGFIPGWEEDCANALAPRDTCHENHSCFYVKDAGGFPVLECNPPETDWQLLNRMKLANSALTLLMLYSLYVYYNYEANIISLRNHVEFSDPRLVRYTLHQVGLLHLFCTEFLLLLVHQIPYVSYDVIVNSTVFSGRPSVYSLDGIFALLMVSRTFQIFRWYSGHLFLQLRSRQFAKRLNAEPMDIMFALRLLVLESPLLASSHFLLGCVALGSYWYRIAEGSTNPNASIYYWDSLWFVVDTLTGLPVADTVIEPKGQFGRAIAVVVRIMGIFWYVLLVNSLRNWVKFRPDELQAQQWLRLSTRTNVLRLSSVRLIQTLFLHGKDHWATLRQLRRFKRAKAKLAAFEEAGQQLERHDFDVFLRAITARRTESAAILDQRRRGLEKAFTDLHTDRLPSTDSQPTRSNRRPSVLASIGAAASKATGQVVKSAKQAPHKLLYASQQAIRKVAGTQFGSHETASDDVEPDMVLPGQVPEVGQAFGRRDEGEGVHAAGQHFGGEGEGETAAVRRAQKASRGIVTGEMNYEVILSAEEKEQLRHRTIGNQLTAALKELQSLRETNDGLLRMLGEEPEKVKPSAHLQREKKLEQWEIAMSKRIGEAEEQFLKLNESMSECMGQLMVLIGGLYDKRKQEQPDSEEKSAAARADG